MNAGVVDARFAEAVTARRSVDEVTFEGVEHLAAPWSDVGDGVARALVARAHRRRSRDSRAACVAHVPPARGEFDDDDRAALRALFEHHARSRLLCVTRVRGFATGADAINDSAARAAARGDARASASGWRERELAPGAPGVRSSATTTSARLYNGDQGLVVRVDSGRRPAGAELMAVFPRGDALRRLSRSTRSAISRPPSR